MDDATADGQGRHHGRAEPLPRLHQHVRHVAPAVRQPRVSSVEHAIRSEGPASAGPFAFARLLGQFCARSRPSDRPMTQPTLRPATAADIPAIAAIYRPPSCTARPASSWNRPTRRRCCAASRPSLRRLSLFRRRARRPRRRLCLCQRLSHPAGYRFTVEDSIYIAPDAQGKGIGRALLERADRIARDNGFRLMIAVIGDSANTPLSACTAAPASRFCGTIHSVGYKFGRWLDSVDHGAAAGRGRRLGPAT